MPLGVWALEAWLSVLQDGAIHNKIANICPPQLLAFSVLFQLAPQSQTISVLSGYLLFCLGIMLPKKKGGFAACCYKSQIQGALAGKKGKWFYSDAMKSERMADSLSQRPSPRKTKT